MKAPSKSWKLRESLAPLVLALLGLWITGSTLVTAFGTVSPALYMDEWDSLRAFLDLSERPGGFLIWLFSHHMEHILVIPRLQFLLEWFVFPSGNRFLITLIFVSQTLTLIALTRPLFQDRIRGPFQSVILATTVLILGFSAAQMENFTWGFQLQFVQVFLWVILSLFTFHIREGKAGKFPFFTQLLGIAATLTMSNGLLIWPVLVISQMLAPRNKWGIASSLLIGGALGYWYFAGYEGQGASGGVAFPQSILQWRQALAFFLIYIGNPIGEWNRSLALVVGVILTLIPVVLLAIHRKHLKTILELPRIRFYLSVLLFLILTAAATTMGRFEMGPAQAASDRYATPALLFLSTLVLLLASMPALPGMNKFRRIRRALGFMVALPVFAVIGAQPYFLEHYTLLGLEKSIGLNAIHYEQRDAQFSPKLYPNIEKHKKTIAWLRHHSLQQEVYKRPGFPDVDPRVLETSAAGTYENVLISITKSPLGQTGTPATIAGTYAVQEGKPFSKAWVLDRHGKPIGRVFDVDAIPLVQFCNFERRPDQHYFYGHLLLEDAPDESGHLFSLYDEKANTRYVAEDPDLVRSQRRDSANVYEWKDPPEFKLSITNIEREFGWTINGCFTEQMIPPTLGQVFGSWSGRDDHTGAIRFDVEIPPGHRSFYLPFVTGPVIPDAEIILSSPEHPEPLVTIEIPANPEQWRYLFITFPSGFSGKTLKVTVIEEGSRWGQWLGIATPCTFR